MKQPNISLFDNVLCDTDFENLVPALNHLRGKIVCPHTDELLSCTYQNDTLNAHRPRSNCFVGSGSPLPITANAVRSNMLNDILNKRRSSAIHKNGQDGQWITKKHIPREMLNLINKHQVDYTGVEWWCYDSMNIEPGQHIAVPKHKDYDGGLEMLTGKQIYPVCSYVYYHEIDIIEGGMLQLYDDSDNLIESIQPVQNRLVVFPSNITHEVTMFTGVRRSFIILPWKNRPREFL